jgi:monovalent cation:H+ antiporter-2, CPA2 family
MEPHQDLLKALAVVLGVSAITVALSRRLRQPVVLGYIVAGLVIGPHVPLPLVADPAIVQTLSELGVTLLMFSLGLEFSLRKLLGVGAAVVVTTVVRCSLLLWLGFATGRIFGWTPKESLFAGAIIAISSTTIVAKAFEEQGITGKLRDLVVGALVVEDLIAVLLLAALTAVATGSGLSATSLAMTAGRLVIFLVALVVVGLLVVPRAMRAVVALRRPEATVVSSVGICLATALLAREMGYSVALGAFIAGSLVAESGEERTVASLVEPIRDVFAAVFFVSVGMMIDPLLIKQNWLAVVVLLLVVVIGKIVSVALGTFFTGHGTRTAIRAGMSLAQIGEFSFIIAGLGVSLHATGKFLYPVAVAVSAITTLLTPWFIRASNPLSGWIDRTLPRPLQTFVALYGSWLERLSTTKARSSEGTSQARRLGRLLLIDTSVLAAIIVTSAVGARSAVGYLTRMGLSHGLARVIAAVAIAAFGLPFAIGMVRVGRRLGRTIAESVFPPAGDEDVDLAAAPRRALVVTLELGLVLLVGAPIVAVTQPFLSGFHGAELLVAILFVLGIVFWRSTTNLQGHVRAGAQVIVEALANQSKKPSGMPVEAPPKLGAILEGLGEPIAVELTPDSPAVGRTLAELNVRGLTGATILAITRGESATIMPSARERLSAGDVLAIAGAREDVETARLLLGGALLPSS